MKRKYVKVLLAGMSVSLLVANTALVAAQAEPDGLEWDNTDDEYDWDDDESDEDDEYGWNDDESDEDDEYDRGEDESDEDDEYDWDDDESDEDDEYDWDDDESGEDDESDEDDEDDWEDDESDEDDEDDWEDDESDEDDEDDWEDDESDEDDDEDDFDFGFDFDWDDLFGGETVEDSEAGITDEELDTTEDATLEELIENTVEALEADRDDFEDIDYYIDRVQKAKNLAEARLVKKIYDTVCDMQEVNIEYQKEGVLEEYIQLVKTARSSDQVDYLYVNFLIDTLEGLEKMEGYVTHLKDLAESMKHQKPNIPTDITPNYQGGENPENPDEDNEVTEPVENPKEDISEEKGTDSGEDIKPTAPVESDAKAASGTAEAGNVTAPQTGDENMATIYSSVMAMFVSLAAALGILKKRKEEK